jgi:hypothetical protein
MASGHVNRIKRPNTWLHRPMLQNVKKLLPTRSRPHMAHLRHAAMSGRGPLCAAKRTSLLSNVWPGRNQSCQLLQLVDDRVYAPKLNTPLGHECHFLAKLRGVSKVDCDRSGIDPAILFDLRDRTERNTNLSKVVGHIDLSLVHAHPLQTGVSPHDGCRPCNPHNQKHKRRLRGDA